MTKLLCDGRKAMDRRIAKKLTFMKLSSNEN
jgi:hypothetical protein